MRDTPDRAELLRTCHTHAVELLTRNLTPAGVLAVLVFDDVDVPDFLKNGS